MRHLPVRVVLAADAAYFPYVPTAINAVICNATGPVEFSITIKDVSQASCAECQRLFPDHEIKFYELSLNDLKGLKVKASISPMAFASVLMPEVLRWDKFVYLDVDAISVSDIRPLFEIDLGAAPFAACFYSGKMNSGVMLINASEWRRRKMTQQVLEYAQKHRQHEADQASIEAVCGSEGIDLDARWNVLIDPIWGRALIQLRVNFDEARVIHFLSRFKPWNLR